MTRPHVPNDALARGDVPDPGAPLAELLDFAHSFHAYKVAGSVSRVTGLAREAYDAWAADGTLPQELTTLRTVLFATARAHDGTGMGQDTVAFVRALVGAIAAATPEVAPNPPLPTFEEASADLERASASDLLDELRGELGLADVEPADAGSEATDEG